MYDGIGDVPSVGGLLLCFCMPRVAALVYEPETVLSCISVDLYVAASQDPGGEGSLLYAYLARGGEQDEAWSE